MFSKRNTLRLLSATALILSLSAGQAKATSIADVCRVRGQETNRLHGIGLVVGLQGSGDSEGPTAPALARTLTLLGAPVGGENAPDFKNLGNVALVHVTATLPKEGALKGGRLTARVSTLAGAKSLQSGYLLNCALVGPLPGDERVFARAEGQVTIEDSTQTTTGKVHDGARLVRDLPNGYQALGLVTLVLENKHAGFSMAQEIEYAINEDKEFEGQDLAKAIDAKTIVVKIPESYRDSPVLFVSALKSIPLDSLPREKRIVINEKAGIIIIGDRVEIRPVAISHKNLSINVSKFIPFAPSAETDVEPLQSLVEAFNTLDVPPADRIEIIKMLDREGAIYGKLIIE